jgi:C4-dicarboxylate-specific signal transduction histidine kinase
LIKRFRRTHTQSLTGAEYVPVSHEPSGGRIVALVSVFFVIVMIVVGVTYFEMRLKPALRVVELEDEKRELLQTIEDQTAQIDRLRLQIEMEAATRLELERQLDTINAALKQVNQELAFLRKAGS